MPLIWSETWTLAFQLKEYDIPIVYSLNLVDVAKRQGINIDVEKPSQELGAPVIPTIAIKNKGLIEILRAAMKLAEEECVLGSKLTDEEPDGIK